jgi:glycosyltransferase involved in cell wall biosynthesis
MYNQKKQGITIICVCAGIGFPIGQANTNRLCHIGKTLVEGGNRFILWHYGTSPTSLNKEHKGIWNGIPFHYLCGRVQRPRNKYARLTVHLLGIIHLYFKILFQITGRKNTYIFFDLQGSSSNILLTLFCRLLRIKTVQEVNEWWPEVEATSKLVKFQYRKIMFRFSNGSFLISKSIRDKIVNSTDLAPHHKFFYLPILSEPLSFTPKINGQAAYQPYIFWCGMVDGYINDVLFIIKAFKLVHQQNPNAKLVISGKHNDETKLRLEEELKACGIPLSHFKLTGFIGNEELLNYVSHAAVLVAPMWEDERSNTRFPTKLGMFAFSGRGIVTAPVGELREYFRNEENCLFYEPGNAESLSTEISKLLNDPEKAARLGKNAKLLAEQTFSYKNYVSSMEAFFANL